MLIVKSLVSLLGAGVPVFVLRSERNGYLYDLLLLLVAQEVFIPSRPLCHLVLQTAVSLVEVLLLHGVALLAAVCLLSLRAIVADLGNGRGDLLTRRLRQ